jgi:hypothetical protein
VRPFQAGVDGDAPLNEREVGHSAVLAREAAVADLSAKPDCAIGVRRDLGDEGTEKALGVQPRPRRHQRVHDRFPQLGRIWLRPMGGAAAHRARLTPRQAPEVEKKKSSELIWIEGQ